MGPAIGAMLGADRCFVVAADSLWIMARLGGFGNNGRRRDIIGLVPAGRIVLERLDHRGQRVLEAMPRLPVDQLAGARDVELIMIVGPSHHERRDARSEESRGGNIWVVMWSMWVLLVIDKKK